MSHERDDLADVLADAERRGRPLGPTGHRLLSDLVQQHDQQWRAYLDRQERRWRRAHPWAWAFVVAHVALLLLVGLVLYGGGPEMAWSPVTPVLVLLTVASWVVTGNGLRQPRYVVRLQLQGQRRPAPVPGAQFHERSDAERFVSERPSEWHDVGEWTVLDTGGWLRRGLRGRSREHLYR